MRYLLILFLMITVSVVVEAKPKVENNYSKCKKKKLKPSSIWYGGSKSSKAKILR